jgi:hypothetical protein
MRKSFRRRHLTRIAAASLVLTTLSCAESVAPGLEIVLSEPTVDFRAVRGSATTLTRSITVSNSGDGRLGPVSCPASPAPWLACAVSNGNTVTLTANSAGLAATPAPVSVSITAAGAADRPRAVLVSLIIDQPVLTLSAATVGFTASDGSNATTPGSATVTVTNTGAGTLASLGAIACVPTPVNARVGCAVNQATGVLTLTVDPAGLAAATYVYPVVVSAPNDNVAKTIAVTLAMSAIPRMVLSQQALVFQMVRGAAAPAAQTVSVTNSGGGSLGTIGCPASPATWLSCSAAGGTLTFAVNPAGLIANPAAVPVSVTATGATNSPQSVTVSLAIRQPVLSVDSTALAFTRVQNTNVTTPVAATVNVTNTGDGTLANLGTIACTPPAVTAPAVSPVTCVVNQSTGQLTFTVDPTGVIGTKLYPVVVSAPNSSVSRVITVTLSAAPGIALSPNELNFQAIRGSVTDLVRKVKVGNAGNGTLGTIACPANPAAWLTCAVTNTDTLVFTAKPAGLTVSPVEVLVPVTAVGAFNNPQTVTVNLTIQQPVLAVNTTIVNQTVAAGGTSTPTVVTVSNAGAGTLASLGTIACATSAARVGCSVNQATGAVSLTVNSASAPALSAGQHIFTVTLSAPNNTTSQTVTIVLTVS